MMVPASGDAFTVTNLVAFAVPQLLVTEYDITAVPADKVVTTPPDTVATAVLPLLHVPPDAASMSVSVDPLHTEDEPVMLPALGAAFTVTGNVATNEPQVLVYI